VERDKISLGGIYKKLNDGKEPTDISEEKIVLNILENSGNPAFSDEDKKFLRNYVSQMEFSGNEIALKITDFIEIGLPEK